MNAEIVTVSLSSDAIIWGVYGSPFRETAVYTAR